MEVRPTGSRWWTRANALTAIRGLCAPFLAHAILADAAALALALFVIAVATDFLDGPVARRFSEASPLGGLLDHATDAAFVSLGLAALAAVGAISPWLPVAILLAFLQYALDSRASHARPLRASSLGRWNGIAYYALLGVPVVRDGLGLGWPPSTWVAAGAWALLASTLFSMGDRALSSWRGGVPESRR